MGPDYNAVCHAHASGYPHQHAMCAQRTHNSIIQTNTPKSRASNACIMTNVCVERTGETDSGMPARCSQHWLRQRRLTLFGGGP